MRSPPMPSSCCGGEVHDLLLVASERVHHERGQAHGKQQAQRDARRLRVARQRDERRACDHTHVHMPMPMYMYMHMHMHMPMHMHVHMHRPMPMPMYMHMHMHMYMPMHMHMHMRRGCSRV